MSAVPDTSLTLRPSTLAGARDAMRDSPGPLLLRGGGTKLGWGASGEPAATVVETTDLDPPIEHNAGDMTAAVGAGMRLSRLQAELSPAGQWLAVDPPSVGAGATVGGIIASGDCGPRRLRYGPVRDIVIGMTVVLSDGAVARSGGRVIKNVAGYDVAKLFAGSFGTLGLIARVAVRLHPAPQATATAVASGDDPARLAAAAAALARLPLEADCIDVGWSGGAGRVLVRFGGATAADRAQAAAERIEGLAVETVTDDVELWARHRAGQRSPDGIVVKVSGRPTDLAAALEAARKAGGTAVARAALGLSWIALPAGGDLVALRQALSPRACSVLDGAGRVADPWPAVDEGTLAVMERVKARFDPARAFRPGAFVGGI